MENVTAYAAQPDASNTADSSPAPAQEDVTQEGQNAPDAQDGEQTNGEGATEKPKKQFIPKDRFDEVIHERNDLRKSTAEMMQAVNKLIELQTKVAQPEKTVDADAAPQEPDENQFETVAEYMAAMKSYVKQLTTYEIKQAQQAIAKQSEAQTQEQKINTVVNKAATHIEKLPDYDPVAGQMLVRNVTPIMRDALVHAEAPEAVAEYLYRNPEEAHKIKLLDPYGQLFAMGQIAARITGKPTPTPQVKPSSAPQPAKQLAGGGATSLSDDAMAALTPEQWLKERLKRN